MLPTLLSPRKLTVEKSKKVEAFGGAVMTALGCTERISAHSSGTTNTTPDNTPASRYSVRLSAPLGCLGPVQVSGGSAQYRRLWSSVSPVSSRSERSGSVPGAPVHPLVIGSVGVAQQPELAGADEAHDHHEHDRLGGGCSDLELHERALVDVHDDRCGLRAWTALGQDEELGEREERPDDRDDQAHRDRVAQHGNRDAALASPPRRAVELRRLVDVSRDALHAGD